MRILGIDYGKKKIGLALAVTKLAEPHKVIRYISEREVLRKIKKIAETERVELIVVGVSEGKMGNETRKFGEKLKREVGLPVEFYDETLSTREAQRRSLMAGIKRKKRKAFEDAYSAAIILQEYLDSK